MIFFQLLHISTKTFYCLQDISHNDLLSIPLGIGFLTALLKLDASHNHLSEVPPELSGLMGKI